MNVCVEYFVNELVSWSCAESLTYACYDAQCRQFSTTRSAPYAYNVVRVWCDQCEIFCVDFHSICSELCAILLLKRVNVFR